MSKARMQPTAQSGIVWKISIFLFILLAVVLYKMNDYFKQEKWQLAQNQLRTQIVSTKTSVSSQISTLKNVLSSYEYELNESKINWVQLDPFFGIAKADRVGGKNSTQYRINQYVGRSGSFGANWNTAFLQKALSRQVVTSVQPITIQLFQDQVGAKFISIRFSSSSGRALIAVGGAEYFQKYFDLSRGGKMTSLLETTDHILAAHSESDYLGSLMDDSAISEKKFLVEREEIAGTNLVAMNFMNRKNLTKGFAVPWSVVGLIIGFGLLIIGVLIYTLDPIERRIEKYKTQERDQVYKDTLADSLAAQAPIDSVPVAEITSPAKMVNIDETREMIASIPQTTTEVVMAKIESAPQPAAPLPPLPDVNETYSRLIEKPQYNPPQPGAPQPGAPQPGAPQPAHSSSHEETVVGKSVANFDETYIPTKEKPKTGAGMLVLDSELQADEPHPMYEYMTNASENIDLDQVLALDDLDVEESAKNTEQYVQENLTSTKINSTRQMAETTKPTFAVKKKDFKVDVVEVPVRRPDRS